jgi:LysM repeat protein
VLVRRAVSGCVNEKPRHRRPHKIRRNGRHAAPTQLQTVAAKAGQATPAVAMVGVLAAAPHAHGAAGATDATVRVTTVAVQSYQQQAVAARQQATRRYNVRPGDTLSSIAQRFYGQSAGWSRIFQANRSVLRNPDMIFPGQVLTLPGAAASGGTGPAALTSSTSLHGTLSCRGLEDLWEEAGGPASEAVTAASIAMAESSGEQFATGPVGERGYWQINPNHGSLSAYDPLGNAKAAVFLSGDGRNWSPWTTFTTGAFRGRC